MSSADFAPARMGPDRRGAARRAAGVYFFFLARRHGARMRLPWAALAARKYMQGQ